MLQINLVAPLKSAQFQYVLSGTVVFTKYLIAVTLTNGYDKNSSRISKIVLPT